MNPALLAKSVRADPAYHALKEHVIRTTGLAYYADKDEDLATRLAQRMARVGLRDCAAYLDRCTAGAAEMDALIEELTIGETFFFRHRELFDALRDIVVPDLIARNRHSRQLRVWSAGCATGAEPYSVSILLRRDLASQVAGWDVTIVGTDINREFLARARAGRFEDWAFRGCPEGLKRDCFLPDGRSWLVKPEYQRGTSFQYHNLAAHPFPSLVNNLFAFDLILCRNVTIYFRAEIVRRIIDRFHQCLVDGGWLLVGHAEPNAELYGSFRTVNAPGAILYQKSPLPSARPLSDWQPPLPEPPIPAGDRAAWVPPVLPKDMPTLAKRGAAPFSPVPEPAALAGAAPSPLEVIRAHADRGEWVKAAVHCEQVLARDQLNPAVHFYRALILEQLGRHADAEQALRRVIYLDRHFVLGHYYLGLLLQKQGSLSQAVRAFHNVLQLLARVSTDQVFADGDGITAGELAKLTRMHLEVLEEA